MGKKENPNVEMRTKPGTHHVVQCVWLDPDILEMKNNHPIGSV